MAKKLAVVFGIVFIIFGILGFISNPIVGAEGYFLTDAIHNAVHLLIGVVLVIAGMQTNKAASMALIVLGALYFVLFLNGLIDNDKLLGFVTANAHDIWLHLVLTIVLLIAGFTSKGGDNAMVMDRTTM